MKTTTLVLLALAAALAAAGPVAADEPAPAPEKACEPVYLDNQGNLQVNPDCIGPPPTLDGWLP